jgi:hypothetical protein
MKFKSSTVGKEELERLKLLEDTCGSLVANVKVHLQDFTESRGSRTIGI